METVEKRDRNCNDQQSARLLEWSVTSLYIVLLQITAFLYYIRENYLSVISISYTTQIEHNLS